MRPLSTLVLAAACSPLSVYAGMYGDPVINLDAKSFKKAMATEHAAVRLCRHSVHLKSQRLDQLTDCSRWSLL